MWKRKLNPQKFEAIFFTRRRTRKAFPNRKLQVENQDIEWQSSAKYFGFTLDQKFTQLKRNTIDKSGKSVRMIYSKISRNSSLNQKNKVLLYKSVIRPMLLYATPILKSAAKTHIKGIQLYQNGILRMCLNKSRRYSTTALHTQANIELVNMFIDRLSLNFEDRSRLVDNPFISNIFN